MEDIKINLREIENKDLEKIMNWRMSPDITKYMNTDPVLTLKGQEEWLKKINEDRDLRYYLIEIEDTPSGVINFSGMNNPEGVIEWGYYIGNKEMRSFLLAISLEMSLYDYLFLKMEKKEVGGFVFKENKGVIKLHKLCGCVEIPEKNKTIEKNGELHNLVYLTIFKDKWLSIREKMKYIKIDFET